MAILIWINFFNFTGPWAQARYAVAIVLALYGIYRCYRQIKGLDYYRQDDEEIEK